MTGDALPWGFGPIVVLIPIMYGIGGIEYWVGYMWMGSGRMRPDELLALALGYQYASGRCVRRICMPRNCRICGGVCAAGRTVRAKTAAVSPSTTAVGAAAASPAPASTTTVTTASAGSAS
jgi:hypothetical protein